MAGKSNKGRNKKGSHTAAAAAAPSGGTEAAVQPDVPANDHVEAVPESANTDAVEAAAVGDATSVNAEEKENETTNEVNQPNQGESGSSTFDLFCMKYVFFCGILAVR
jgi:protein TIF31